MKLSYTPETCAVRFRTFMYFSMADFVPFFLTCRYCQRFFLDKYYEVSFCCRFHEPVFC